jgi:hypothetical protein
LISALPIWRRLQLAVERCWKLPGDPEIGARWLVYGRVCGDDRLIGHHDRTPVSVNTRDHPPAAAFQATRNLITVDAAQRVGM